ncbi:MAG: hypothetical protein OXG84_01780 [Chloroflexi bacterium]|nr:hypothetical protein [Chloroflexota bacterium]
MWRAKLLLKLFFRAFAYSAVTEVVLGTLILFIFLSGLGFLGPVPLLHMLLLNGLASMISAAMTLALPMTLVTALCFREIRRPKFYRFAMLTVALLTSILVWPGHFEGMGETLQSNAPADLKALDAVHLLTHALAIFSAQLAAGKYVRDLALRHPAKHH